MRLSIIVAMADEGVIGRDGDLPWRLPADLRFFKRVTMGHHLLMGRRTWESIGRPLPGRSIIVLTRERSGGAERFAGCQVAHDLPQAIEQARVAGDDEAFVAGGAEVYARALPLADRMYLTRVWASVEGDTRFPAYEASEWVEVSREDHEPDDRHAFRFSFMTLDRRR